MSENIEEVNLFDDEVNDVEPDTQAVEESVSEELEQEATSFQVPDKFKGKSFEDVVESYVNLEKESGRRANEVGELRQLTDQILKQQLSQPPAQQLEDTIEEVGVDDFFDNPTQAVNKALENNPKLKSIEEHFARDAQRVAHEKLTKRHPDVDQVIGSSEFQNWVQSSPTRLKMFQECHQSYDADAGGDLLDMYKTTAQVSQAAATAARDETAARELKQATTERGNVSPNTKKVYRRSELIRLKIERPSQYAAMADEIRSAYAEGRVK